jgi:hypothetical protein
MKALFFLNNSREWKQWMLAVFIIAGIVIGLLRLPLFNQLGYEYSAVLALAVPWLCGGLAIGSFRSRFTDQPDARLFLSAASESIMRSVVLLVIPYLAAGINTAFVKNCAFTQGTEFYILIPVVTAIWSASFGIFSYTITKRPVLFFTLAHLLVLLYPLYVGYTQPQIFSYNIVYGYFPGFSYDEILPVTGTLILFRAITLAAALFFLALSFLVIRKKVATPFSGADEPVMPALMQRRKTGPVVVSLFLILIGAWYFRVGLGFESSEARLREVLSSLTVTEHFRIYTAPGVYTREEVERIAAEHEFRYYQVSTSLQTYPSEPVTSYIYPSDEIKRELLGTATTSIAKPWMREIHLSSGSWRQLLKHELTHVVAGEFGMPVIRANYHIGLVEGLAMSVDPHFGNRTLHQYAASLIHYGIVRDPAALINPAAFALGYSSVSYVMMGSFCQYLRSRYGNFRFKEYYGGQAPETVFGRSATQLANDWQLFLQKAAVPDSTRNHVDFYFRRQSIFARECARWIAELNESGSNLLERRLPAESLERYRHAWEVSPNSDSYAGIIRASFAAQQFRNVDSLMEASLADSATAGGVSGLLLLYGDALARIGQAARADSIYQAIALLDISPRYDEAAQIRLAAERDTLLYPLLQNYFGPEIPDSLRARWIDSASASSSSTILRYLGARRLFGDMKYEEAIRNFTGMDLSGQPPIFGYLRDFSLGQASFALQKYEDAKIDFWGCRNYTTNGALIEETDDWIERCEWYGENGSRYLH